MMYKLWLALFLLTWSFASKVSAVSVHFKAEYYSNTTLVCDDKLLSLPYTTFKKYWILPSGEQLPWSYEPGNHSRYIVGEFPDFNLTISNIDDDDFGWYYCVILWDDYIYLIHTIKVGLNVEGASYEELLEQYKDSAFIGLIAGGITATILGLCCLLHWCRYSETNTENDETDIKKKNALKGTEKISVPNESESTLDEESAKENAAIYELDKAVHDFDEDESILGNGEVAIGVNEDEEKDVNSSNDETRVKSIIAEMKSLNKEYTESSIGENLDLTDNDLSLTYDIVPPPPPPPPFMAEDKDSTEQGVINRGFEAIEGDTQVADDSEEEPVMELNYLYLDNTQRPDNEHYSGVRF